MNLFETAMLLFTKLCVSSESIAQLYSKYVFKNTLPSGMTLTKSQCHLILCIKQAYGIATRCRITANINCIMVSFSTKLNRYYHCSNKSSFSGFILMESAVNQSKQGMTFIRSSTLSYSGGFRAISSSLEVNSIAELRPELIKMQGEI